MFVMTLWIVPSKSIYSSLPHWVQSNGYFMFFNTCNYVEIKVYIVNRIIEADNLISLLVRLTYSDVKYIVCTLLFPLQSNNIIIDCTLVCDYNLTRC